MALKKGKKYFVPGGKVPDRKDGTLIWSEKDPRADWIWFAKPVSRTELPADVVEKPAASAQA
ncbi:MAG: hypothetical protein H5U04_00050 [Firmicutes bacterium]|nr:hypothetical protein [Bacillota bacterium]